MSEVRLEPITKDNYRVAIKLELEEDQKGFVAPNCYSLVQLFYEPELKAECLAIYAGEDMVGFLMHANPKHNGNDIYAVFRLMIAKNFQGNGYGRSAMQEIIKRLSEKPDCDSIYISYVPENVAAAKLYESLGFLDEGVVEDGEIVVRLPIEKSKTQGSGNSEQPG